MKTEEGKHFARRQSINPQLVWLVGWKNGDYDRSSSNFRINSCFPSFIRYGKQRIFKRGKKDKEKKEKIVGK